MNAFRLLPFRPAARSLLAASALTLLPCGPSRAADAKLPKPDAPAAAPRASEASAKVHRIVFQVTIDGQEHWNAILNQIENVQKGFAPEKVEIEVVTHGNATGFVLASNKAVSDRIQAIGAAGATFSYCANTQKKHNVKPEELTPGVTIIPSGLVQVIRRQEEGWSYIKGGS